MAPHLLRAPSALVLMSPWGDMSESFEVTPAELAMESVAHDWASLTNREEMIQTIKAFLWNKSDDITDSDSGTGVSGSRLWFSQN